MDFSARVQTSLEEARPHREKHIELAAQAKTLENEFRERRKEKNLSPDKLDALEEKMEGG